MNTEVIEKKHPLFDRLSFVLKARSDDETRAAMQILHIDERSMVCTDGLRMHIFTGACLTPGDYRILTATKQQIVLTPTTSYQFPEWKKVMPDKSEYQKIEGKLDLDCASLKKTQLHNLSKAYFSFIKQTDCLIDLNYLNDLSGHTWEVSYKAIDKAVLFENSYLTAVIMPMQQA